MTTIFFYKNRTGIQRTYFGTLRYFLGRRNTDTVCVVFNHIRASIKILHVSFFCVSARRFCSGYLFGRGFRPCCFNHEDGGRTARKARRKCPAGGLGSHLFINSCFKCFRGTVNVWFVLRVLRSISGQVRYVWEPFLFMFLWPFVPSDADFVSFMGHKQTSGVIVLPSYANRFAHSAHVISACELIVAHVKTAAGG